MKDVVRQQARGRPGKVQQVKRWVKAALGLRAGDVVVVTELPCRERGYPPFETVISVVAAGQRPLGRVHRRLAALTRDDVAKLCASMAVPGGGSIR